MRYLLSELKLLIIEEVKLALEAKRSSRSLFIFDFDKTVAITKERYFNEFARVNGAKPNREVFATFANLAASAPERTYILTARPILAHDDILRFLSNNGVKLAPENVACVSGTGATKSKWIKQKITEHNANELIFWDDKMENIRAVEKLQTDPDMKGIKITTKLVGNES